MTNRFGLAVALSTLTVACGGLGSTVRVAATSLPRTEPTLREAVPSALDNPAAAGLPAPSIPVGDIVSGGPPPDGIPSIDRPRFERASTVSWLSDREPILAVDVGGESRAYPVQILTWHEIVNDTIAGIPVAVTYCPLCNSALVFDRRDGSRVLDFGTSGRLYRSNLLMYDRQTQSLWAQLLGESVAGVLTGTRLKAFSASTISWKAWRAEHPTSWVLSRETGFERDYGANPYPGYDAPGSPPYFPGSPDNRLPAKTRVVGLHMGSDELAITLDSLRRHHAGAATAGGRPVVVWEQDGTGSALDGDRVDGGRDVGTTAAFSPTVEAMSLHFTALGGGFEDSETHSRWNIFGRAVAGALEGRALVPIEHVDTFWFAWVAFAPHTRLIR